MSHLLKMAADATVANWSPVGLILFLSVFVAFVFNSYRSSQKALYVYLASLPLEGRKEVENE